jgi:uncharacterized membrane protein
MAVLIVLFLSWLLLRSTGTLGVAALASWHDSARYALAVMFVFTAIAHFNRMKHDLARMIPSFFPKPLLLVYITGVLELLGAAGLLLPRFRALAGICLILLLLAMFIANVNASQKHLTLRGRPVTPLRFRAPPCKFSSSPSSTGPPTPEAIPAASQSRFLRSPIATF